MYNILIYIMKHIIVLSRKKKHLFISSRVKIKLRHENNTN